MTVFLNESQQKIEDLHLLSSYLLASQEERRRKISRDLHVVISQTLTGIHLLLAGLKDRSNTSNSDLRKHITRTQRLVVKTVAIVHRFAHELRPTLLDDLGLIPALQALLKCFTEDTGIGISLKVCAAIEEADGALRTMLYRVAQEALTNVALHANASQVEMSIESLNGGICMEIRDNGQGFEVNGISRSGKPSRLGLLAMRERVAMLGGTFGVDSAPGHPTTVRVAMPPPQRLARKKSLESPATSNLKSP